MSFSGSLILGVLFSIMSALDRSGLSSVPFGAALLFRALVVAKRSSVPQAMSSRGEGG